MDNVTSLPLASNDSDSAVTWNRVLLLVVLSIVSTCGSIGGVFMISGVTVVEPLQTRGNIYLVSYALGHLLVTGLVLPSSCVAILAGVPEEPIVCNFQWLTTILCFIVSVLSAMFISIDSFLGLGSAVTYDLCCTKGRIVSSVFFTWLAAIGFVIVQHINQFGPSMCKTTLKIYLPYHVTVGVALILIPILLCIWYFGRSLFKLKTYKHQVDNFHDPSAYILTDEHLLRSNILNFILMLFMWMPLAIVSVVNAVRPAASGLINTAWWVAVANSCIYSYVYAGTNREFREAFSKLFYYCCCKSHVSFSRPQREARRDVGSAIGLRVHIIPSLNIYAQRKETLKDTRTYQPKSPYDL